MISADDRFAILELYAAYNRAIDGGDAMAWAETFVSEGVFHHPARTWRGRSELQTFVTTRSASIASGPLIDMRHWNDAIGIEQGEDGATGRCDLVVTGRRRDDGTPAVAALGEYVDRIVREGSAWRFAERTLTIV